MILLLIITTFGLIKCSEFTYSDCATTDPSLRMSGLTLVPHPIIYPKPFVLSMNLEVLKDIPIQNAKVKVSARKTSPKQLAIKCIFGYGSCTYSYCEFWKQMHDMTPQTTVPECPLSVGNYSYENSKIIMPTSSVIKFFKSILRGSYSVDFILLNDATKQVYGCNQINFTIEFDASFKWDPNIDERLDRKYPKKLNLI